MSARNKQLLALGAAGLTLAWLARPGRPRYSFANRTVLITGGSRGLGLVIARQLTREGARVAICARAEGELSRAAADLAQSGPPPVTAVADVGDPMQVSNAIRHVQAQLGPIDVLINNAGIISVGPLASMTRSDFEQALQVSFWGAYNTIEAVLPGMRARRSGRIINISSIGGKIAVPHLAPYCVGKFALVGYSSALRAELAHDGIVVTTVCPGLMRTGSPRNALFKGNRDAEFAWFKLGDSLPLLTVSAEHAARQILEASRCGDAELVISFPAKLGTLLQALCPGTLADLMVLANQFLPSHVGSDRQAKPGRTAEVPRLVSALTALTDRAAARNNELAPGEFEAE